MTLQQKRKKWTEEEERSLIEKYSEMQSSGTLRRLPTREKRFRPIADHVNASHHALDPSSFPFVWSWKDVSTKAQNMRNQYLLVKQKLLPSSPSSGDPSDLDALSLWPNFLRYRQVFGDAPLKPADPADADPGLGFGSEIRGEDEFSPVSVVKRRKKKGWGAVAAMVARMGEWEERMEERELKREKERRRRAAADEVAARRREEEEREWEERREKRREEWRKRMEETMARHRAEMEQVHARVLHDQQAIISQLLAFISPDSGAHHHHHHHHHSPFLSQMMNGMVAGENRDGGDGQEDQFIVDE
ncbi:C-terminal domain of PLC-beta-containing protein [Dioscorea alata]|uniref:C-terminal domain of PLC-beta-containing protein n=1 Tax=Dioscorea alata TaxID=55571 RepID=A0ACB7V9J0_DIOAL|nr:C-terminal domain of PLC-beta-containing protein [Dioscorea alata]